MSLSHHKQKAIIAFFILIAAAYAGNYFSVPLFFGVDCVFGSIAVLLVVRFFGTIWGTLAAIISSSYTILLWHNPYAAISLILEAMFVGWLWHRKQYNIVLLDGIYWLLIGMPYLWLTNFGIMHVNATQTLLIVLKSYVNGVFNALFASLIIAYLPIHKWVGRPTVNNKISLQQTLFNLLVAFVFLPALMLMVLDGQRVYRDIDNNIQVELKSTSAHIASDIQHWQYQYLNGLSELGKIALESDMEASDMLQQSTKIMKRMFPDFDNLYVVNPSKTIITSYPTTNQYQNSKIGVGVLNQSLVQQTKATLQPSKINVHIDPILLIPHLELSVPVVIGDVAEGFAYGSLNLSHISQLLQLHTAHKDIQVTLVDKQGNIVASTKSDRLPMQVFDHTSRGEIQFKADTIYQWLPAKGNMPLLTRWYKSLFVQETLISGNIPWTLVVELPAAPHVSYLQNFYIKDLTIMVLISGLTLLLAVKISRRLVSPLLNLAYVTSNLPDKLLEQEKINWSFSSVIEIDLLSRNFKLMAIALKEKFREICIANETLEKRVTDRTGELLHTNQQLAIAIAEHKRTEEALRESEERFRQMAENIQEVFWMSNPDVSEIIYVSPAYEEIWERSRESLYANPKSWLDKIHPEDRESAIASWATHSHTEYNIEYRLVRSDGSIRWIWDRGFPIRNQAGEIYRMVGIAKDITQRKTAEQEIRSALLKERQLGDLKSRFITTASHEFRTPLTTILMSAKLLERFSQVATEEKKRMYINRIEVATNQMTQLLDGVLLIGKAEAGKLEFNPAPMDLEQFCRELVEEMELTAVHKYAIVFQTLFANDFLCEGDCNTTCLDEKLLRYILNNLLSNAMKYSPQGGKVYFDLICGQTEAIFRIKDEGIGIPEADKAQLFDSFHRGSNVRNISGTGLGLSIVKQCVDLHGGKVTFHSEVGVGSTFIVTLPL
ncbi:MULTISPECIES: ATP-binding protein [Cyanophyceae]|uniref:ATP-binding protein n=1 Tax=Cyanophyceae TaxID=3028117 RepID=UPI00168764F4|nr:ATP-binding protein [Trichocoleus sp. FACHB-40]MBD2005904.1 PAS domain-containing protein [Trichocoleus sp. FACHB-40]